MFSSVLAMNAKYITIGLLVVLSFTLIVHGSSVDADDATSVPKQTFKEAEKEVIDFVTEQLRSLLPKIVGGAGSTTLSQRCQAGMMKIFGSIRRLKGWTLKILDSMGKPSAGILKGNSYSLGHYDQCVNLFVTSKGYETTNVSDAMFQGMYCKVRVQFKEPIVETAKNYYKGKINETDLGKLREIILATPYVPLTSEFMSHFLGVCVPSICTLEDVKEIVHMISVPASLTIEKCEIQSDIELDGAQTAAVIVFAVLISLVCLSTLIHWLFCFKAEDTTLTPHKDCRFVSISIAFSFCNNSKRLVKNIEDDANHSLAEQSVRGIVVASVCWIILGYTYLLPYDVFYTMSSSLENLQNYLTEEYFSVIVGYSLAVDALFVSYGFIMTYSLWYAACKTQDIKVNVISLLIQNYFRILIPVLIFLGVAILLPIVGSGPFWSDFVDVSISKCYKNPWAYVGMYSNFLDENEQCFPHLWFASCLAQLTLVSIIISWILSKKTKLGMIIIVFLMVASNVVVVLYTYFNSFPPSYVGYFGDEDVSSLFWKLNYSLPLSHFGPYALGMLSGILVARKSRHPLRPFLALAGWIICLCLLFGLFLFLYKHHLEPIDAFWVAMYAGTHRTLFAVCIAWIIVSCSFGNGGFVNAIFSWKVFDPLFRLSYYAYVLHFLIIALTVGTSREHFSYSHLDLMLRAVSYITVSYIISYFAYLILEFPLKSLCALCRKKSNQINVTSLNNLGAYYKADNLMPSSTIGGSCKLWSVSNNKIAPES